MAIITLYATTLPYPFNYDDELFVKLHFEQTISSYLQVSFVNLPNRILVFLTFALNHLMTPNSPEILRATNIVIHLFASIGLYFLCYELTAHGLKKTPKDATYAALIAAMFFASHPIQTQAVTFIWQRCASQTALFAIWGIWAWFRSIRPNDNGVRSRYIYLSIGMLLCAVFSKENGLTAVMVIALGELFVYRTKIDEIKSRMGPVAAITGILLIVPIRHLFWGDILSEDMKHEFFPVTSESYFLTQMHVILKYISLVILPVQQTLDYDFPVSSRVDLQTFFALVFHLFLFVYGIILGVRKHIAGFLITSFYAFLSVEASIVPIADVIVEHRLYLPMAVPAIGLGMLWTFSQWRSTTSAIAIVYILSLCVTTVYRNQVWSSESRLWLDVVSKARSKPRGHENLGVSLLRSGKLDSALKSFENSFIVGNSNPQFLEKIVGLQLDLGLNDEARRLVEVFPRRQIKGNDLQLHLATIEQKSGNLVSALVILDEIVTNDVSNWNARFNIIEILLKINRPKLAADHFAKLADRPEESLAMADLNTQLLYALGDERYKDSFANAMNIANGSLPEKLRMARLASVIGYADTAEDLFRSIWIENPGPIFIEFIVSVLETADFARVRRNVQEYQRIFPEDFQSLARVTQLLADKKQWHLTVELITYLINSYLQSEPDNSDLGKLYFNLALANIELLDFFSASLALKEAKNRGYDVPNDLISRVSSERF